MGETYAEYQERIKSKQEGLPKDEIKQQLESEAEHVMDLDNLPSVKHRWVKRGIVVSCENGGHASHRHFLIKR